MLAMRARNVLHCSSPTIRVIIRRLPDFAAEVSKLAWYRAIAKHSADEPCCSWTRSWLVLECARRASFLIQALSSSD